MEEILHQLIGGKHPIIDRVSTIRLVMQDFFHPQYVVNPFVELPIFHGQIRFEAPFPRIVTL